MGHIVNRDVLPIFVISVDKTPASVASFEGTGFIIAPELFMTCWHCVERSLPENKYYAAAIEENGIYKPHILHNITQDENGSDIAIAQTDLKPNFNFQLASSEVDYGTDVITFGYPLTDKEQLPNGQLLFTLNSRYLQGYIARSYYHEHDKYGKVASYEIDMPAPEGLSGAPLITMGTKEIIGIIYGSNEVATIDRFMSIDPETGKKEPEIQKVVSFALAHHTNTLLNFKAQLTNNVSLNDYLKCK